MHRRFLAIAPFGGVGLVPLRREAQAGPSANDVMHRLRGAGGTGWAGATRGSN
jgi:hypothetical protein